MIIKARNTLSEKAQKTYLTHTESAGTNVLRNDKGQFVKGHEKPKEMLQKMSNSLQGRTVWNKGRELHYDVWNKGMDSRPKCLDCGKQLTHYKTKRCRKCANEGILNPSWRGGITEDKKQYNKNYKQINRERLTFLQQKRRVLKNNAVGSHTFEEWKLLKEFYGNMCLCCKKLEPEIKLTEDHIIPLSMDGSDEISNIQPLCIECNSIKRTKTIDYRGELIYVN